MTTSPLDKLSTLLSRIAAAPSPFYRDRVKAIGRDAAALSRLSLTTRDDLVLDQLAHLPHGTRRCADAAPPVRAGVTGSGATLLVLTWTAADLARERAAGARLLGRIGIAAGMRVANTLPGALVTPGALLLGDVIEEIGALDVPLGAITSEAVARGAWELFDRVQPNVLVLDGTAARLLLSVAPPAERPWWWGIVWVQAAGVAAQCPAPPAAAGFSGWQRTWLAVAEVTSFIAHSCSAGRFHADDELFVEVVDDTTGATLLAGRDGAIALTPFAVDTPVLRYLSGLRGRIVATGCPCGAGGVAIEIAPDRIG